MSACFEIEADYTRHSSPLTQGADCQALEIIETVLEEGRRIPLRDIQTQAMPQYSTDAKSATRSQLERFVAHSHALDLTGIAWHRVAEYPLAPEAIRTLLYMQEVESHTVVFPRTIFSTRAVNDEILGLFLTCWLYEESFHGRALARFLAAAGHDVPPRPKGHITPADRVEARIVRVLSAVWRDFPALHMAWGALHELTTLTAYRRLSALANHPILTELLSRIIRDEARHFSFYYWQAKKRLQRPIVVRLTRFLLAQGWAPVGRGVRPLAELCSVVRYLFSGTAGHAAVRRVDQTIQRLPDFAGMSLLEAWIDREVGCWPR
jgi:hypothetical protein